MGIEEIEVKGSFTWGVMAATSSPDHVGAEASWAQQQSALVIGTAAGSADLFDMKLGLLHGSFVYQFGSADRPSGHSCSRASGPRSSARDDLESETKLSWALGAGLKWFPSTAGGSKASGPIRPTFSAIRLPTSAIPSASARER